MPKKTTPLLEQYLKIKQQYKDAVLFFRMGDFYEMFFDDAKIASDVLGIVLTSRAHGKSADVPLAGFPYHSLEPYLSKMLKAGHRVAVCEQVEDPKKAKGIVKREVLEVITPGTATSENVIDSDSNNFLISLYIDRDKIGMSGLDVSTGEFFLTEDGQANILSQIESMSPSEILYPSDQGFQIKKMIRINPEPLFTPVDDYYYSIDYATETLTGHFKTLSLKGFGCDNYPLGISAAGAALKYLQQIQTGKTGHIRKLTTLNPSNYMMLDKTTRRNLEIISPMHTENRQGSLLSVIDRTVTRMGSRLLKIWLLRPLLEYNEIRKRHFAVGELFENHGLRNDLTDTLRKVNDIERIIARINAGRANGRDFLGLNTSLLAIPGIIGLIKNCHASLLKDSSIKLDPLSDIAAEIDRAITGDPPVRITEGRLIKEGYDEELDRIRNIAKSGKQWILDLQKTEREETGITSLKINYNKVFGYYIEVTKPHLPKVPDRYIRKQTLVNAERYITSEMKEREEEILNAEERSDEFEKEIFLRLCGKIAHHTSVLQENADLIARLDVVCGLAEVALENNYCKPEIMEDTSLDLVECRHPVVEKLLPPGEPFIPNDHKMDISEEQIHIITGPNMAGKSTFLRQVGLCALLAQIGSFVPAASAKIGIVDRIFTRVGAMDDVSRGESTFLVEMIELANILNNATPQSLLLLDEIGRGTSTFDGLSIAWATVEYIHNNLNVAAKTLFATHYHELTSITKQLPKVKNFSVQVKEWKDSVIFLRKILPGSADHSYGIQVARMAGVPVEIINRAREILDNLESHELKPDRKSLLSESDPIISATGQDYQINLFSFEDTRIREKLNSINPETISPLEAIQLLFELQFVLTGKDKPSSTS